MYGLDQVVSRFEALVAIVQIVIPVQSVEYEKAHREYQDEDDVHQPRRNRLRIGHGRDHSEYENL